MFLFEAVRNKSVRSVATGGSKLTQKTSSKTVNSPTPVLPRQSTMFDRAAMENLYYIAHNAADALVFRGFGFVAPSALRKNSKKTGRKAKKKR